MRIPSLLPALLLALILAACGSGEPAPPRVAAWLGDRTGILFMQVISEAPLRDARLTAPNDISGGGTILATRISQTEPAGRYGGYGGRPSVGIGGVAGSSGSFGTGIGLSFPIGGGAPARGGLSSQIEFELTPEQRESYRARSQDWLLELRFDDRIASLKPPPVNP